jgi:hypothetical protein
MNFLAWILCLTILIVLMIQAVSFHRATVCRQEAWLKSTELATYALLSNPKSQDRALHLGCKLQVYRKETHITWQVLPSYRKHKFSLSLDGSL